MNKRIFCYTFIAAILGTQIAFETSNAMVVALIAAVTSLLLFKWKQWAVFALSLSIFTVISVALYPVAEKSYDKVSVCGTITDLEAGMKYSRVTLEDCDHKEIGKFRLEVSFEEQYESLVDVGDVIRVWGEATPVSGREVHFYEQPYIEEDYYTMFATRYRIVERGEADYFYTLKKKIASTIFDNVSDYDGASVLYAMISGDKQWINGDVSDAFVNCGTSHLLAVSGLHVSIILGVILFLLKGIRLNKRFSFILLVVFLAVFAYFIGGTSSVMRACIMALFAQLSIIYGARYDSLNSLCFAGTTILAIEPIRFYNVGFLLSFAACFGILWISRYFVKKPKLLRGIINGMLITIGATVATMPIQVYFFRTASVISVLANALLVPFASFSLALAFVFLVVSMIFPPLAILLEIPGAIMSFVIKAAKWLGNVPCIEFKAFLLIVMLLVFAGFVFFTRFVHVKKRKILGILLIILPIFCISTSVFNNNYVKFSKIKYSQTEYFFHIESDQNYVIGLTDEFFWKQKRYIDSHMTEIDVLILLDRDDVSNFEKIIESGITYKKLLVASNLKIDRVLRRNGAKPLTKYEDENFSIEYKTTLYYVYENEKMSLGSLNMRESPVIYLRG